MFEDELKQLPQDVTHQSLRLARRIDRLPNGEYIFKLVKGDKSKPWALVLWNDAGATIADTELER